MEQVIIFNQSELRTIIADTVNACLADWQPQPAPAPQPSDYITRRQTAELLHCSLVSIHAWAKQGKVKLYHFAGKTYLNRAEVMAAMKPVNYSLQNEPVLKNKGGKR